MIYKVSLNGKCYEINVENRSAAVLGVSNFVESAAPTAAVTQTAVSASQPATGEPIPSPMPGNIIAINVNVGDAVKKGQVLFILEAMKMENEILAPKDGTISKIAVSQGATVAVGESLANLA